MIFCARETPRSHSPENAINIAMYAQVVPLRGLSDMARSADVRFDALFDVPLGVIDAGDARGMDHRIELTLLQQPLQRWPAADIEGFPALVHGRNFHLTESAVTRGIA